VRDFGVTSYDASVLASERALGDYFDAAVRGAKKPKNVANWIINDLLSALSAAGRTITDCPISPKHWTSW
jgi:aspartyl-tRNA(Asn)/glutamyl-tRNA(Gln) amidotransferase subunit B